MDDISYKERCEDFSFKPIDYPEYESNKPTACQE